MTIEGTNPEREEQATAGVEPAQAGTVPAEPVAEAQTPPAPVAPAGVEVEAEPAAGRPTEEELAAGLLAARLAANQAVLAASAKHTRRSFVFAAAGAAAAYGFYRWVEDGPQELRLPIAQRRAFEANAAIARAVFEERGLAPTYPVEQAENLRVNGTYGLKQPLDPASYRLQLVGSRDPQANARYAADVTAWEYRYLAADSQEDQGHDTKVAPGTRASIAATSQAAATGRRRMPRGVEEAGPSLSGLSSGTPGLLLTLDDVLRLPRYELVTQFKCIEGWSQIVQWSGVRLGDFLEAYPPALVDGKEPRYVYMETPNGDYYTGYDIDACRHPQSLLVTEMMGAPLTQFHGAPLRLHMPIKYGYKQIKRIGLIAYTNRKPDDYWTKLGYDWYAGL